MDDDRSEQINSAILKAVGLVVAVGVVIAIGTWGLVHVLGLNNSGGGGTTSAYTQPTPVSPLPSTALPNPSSSTSPDAGQSASDVPTQDGKASKGARGLHLNVTPLVASSMQRLSFTGTYRNHDNMALQVQTLQNGSWTDFPVQANVNLGTFETYVETGTRGADKFRVYDPSAGKASNVVTVQIQ